MKLYICMLLLIFCLPLRGYAGSHFYAGHSTQNASRGFNYLGLKNSAEVLLKNPAALASFKEDISIVAGSYSPLQYMKYSLKEPAHYEGASVYDLRFPFYLYASARVSEKIILGFAYAQNSSVNIRWQEENWAGRFIVKRNSLQTNIFRPSLTYVINDNYSVGAAMTIGHKKLNFTRALPFRDHNREGHATFSGEKLFAGFTISFYASPFENIQTGLAFSSGNSFYFDDVSFDFTVPYSLNTFFNIENNSLDIHHSLPPAMDFSAGWTPSQNFMITGGVAIVFRERTDDAIFDFASNNEYLRDFRISNNHANEFIVRLGAEYQVNDYICAAGGIFYSPAYADPQYNFPGNPSMHKTGISTGGSFFPIPGLSVDISFTFISGSINNTNYAPANFAGNYKSNTFIPGVGITLTM